METPVLTSTAAAIGQAVPGGKKNKMMMKKMPWEYIALAALGSATIITGTILAVQWKHAKVGRKVENDVIKFLKQYGASVNGKKISGGPINTPVSVEDAVTGTVSSMIGDIHARVEHSKKQKALAAQGAQAAQAQVVPEMVIPRVGGSSASAGGLIPQPMAPLPASGPSGSAGGQRPMNPAQGQIQMQQQTQQPSGPHSRSARSGGMQVSGGISAPAGSLQPENTGARGSQPEFPEAPISGRTGTIVKHDVDGNGSPQMIGTMTRDSDQYGGDGDGDGDYSYAPPTPPGMHMPPGGSIPQD